jgi:hypothetical protein
LYYSYPQLFQVMDFITKNGVSVYIRYDERVLIDMKVVFW